LRDAAAGIVVFARVRCDHSSLIMNCV